MKSFEKKALDVAARVNTLVKGLDRFTDLVDEKDRTRICTVAKDIDTTIADDATEGRKLCIGIVGQVKAGKSSFLNALLFEGRDLLPKSVTPMTAALTFLSYSDEPRAEIEFYTQDDWKTVQALNHQYQQKREELLAAARTRLPAKDRERAEAAVAQEVRHAVSEDVAAAYDLISQVKRDDLDVAANLGKCKTVTGKDIPGLLKELNQFVGANGRYTPFTRNVRLFLNEPILRDIEVVDTPGTNDPIVARGKITRDFLAKCDCVLFLCYSGQFMGQEDTGFVLDSLPNQGISRVILVGSKFDSVLMDEAKKYHGDLIHAARDVTDKLEGQARDTLLPVINANQENPTVQALSNSLPPLFISALCHNMAVKDSKGIARTELEEHVAQQFAKDFPDFDLTPEFLFGLANIDRIRKREFAAILAEKETIRVRKLEDFLTGKQRETVGLLNDLRKRLAYRLEQLRTKDTAQLEAQAHKAEVGLAACDQRVRTVFGRTIREVAQRMDELKRQLAKDAAKAKRLDINEREEFSHDERYGFFWLKKRAVYQTVKYGKVHDAVENICTFVNAVNDQVSERWQGLIDQDALKDNLKEAVLPAFDTSDVDFDAQTIIGPVEDAANEIMMPSFDLAGDKYEQRILSAFSGATTVTDYEAEELVKLQRKVVNELMRDIRAKIESLIKKATAALKQQGDQFLASVSGKMRAETETIKAQLRDRKAMEVRYEEFLTALDAARNKFE